ncbi:polysaccharide deacetylase family protein [Cupriavidus sp. IK-TO18]|uniref:polysaccharide deacetylase family protein n=1 Tax=Cupriavidus sp. IK-TO18 TaxID=2782182 RepID=UPI001898B5B9|nr:polysaccharide deacetylase family protein [Cupriavidus sp. IK-TO18]MBF6987944.1 4-deoxy-4-formamido-L-arabinose-phosphoundecaprenol deformylase [Cupriavidus sp. IK-TO18]
MARIALKVDVDTLRGTREGVPKLLSMLDAAQAQATFLFSLGPDHTGWALRRVFRPGFLKKVSRTSVVSNYGLRTLMYGVLLPGPDIGRKGAAEMRAARAAGHECGIHTWDHVYWQDNVRERDAAWTRRQMQQAFARYTEVFGEPPATHGAAGWQMNEDAFRQIDDWGMAYASDGRGTAPYIPTIDGVPCRHVQMPTTLPTLDELIGTGGLTEDNVHTALLKLTEGAGDHVFTLHTELEGGKLAPVFERLLAGWRAQGHELVSMAAWYRGLERSGLPQLPVTWGEIPGRSGELIVQPEVLSR